MLAKIFLLGFLSSNLAFSHSSDDPPMIEYKIEKETKLYSRYQLNEYFGSIVVPKGFTIGQIEGIKKFRDGKIFDISDTDTTLRKAVEVSGVKRTIWISFTLGGRASIKAGDASWKKTSEERAKLGIESFSSAAGKVEKFEYPEGFGFYRYISTPGQSPTSNSKKLILATEFCGASFSYEERDTKTNNALPRAEWKFEAIGDQIARSFRCHKATKSENTIF